MFPTKKVYYVMLKKNHVDEDKPESTNMIIWSRKPCDNRFICLSNHFQSLCSM